MSTASQKRGETGRGEVIAAKVAQFADRLDKTEVILDYHFKNRELLLLAITHPSASEGNGIPGSYERLEFLGDAILGAIISRELYDRYPRLDEGALTRLKVSAVAGYTLARLAEALELEKLIIFGSSERGTGRRGLQSALENVYEALVGALAIDGGMEAAEQFVLRTLAPLVNISVAREPENPKSMLQELLQTHHITPTYEIIDTDGPPHDRFFTARVLSDEETLAIGSGHSKKDAEMDAATKALEAIHISRVREGHVHKSLEEHGYKMSEEHGHKAPEGCRDKSPEEHGEKAHFGNDEKAHFDNDEKAHYGHPAHTSGDGHSDSTSGVSNDADSLEIPPVTPPETPPITPPEIPEIPPAQLHPDPLEDAQKR